MGASSSLLAPVPPQLLQPPSARSPPMEVGQVQAHWRAFVSVAYPVPQPPRPLAPRAFILAFVATQSLLQTISLVLGKMEANWSSFVPASNLQALDRLSLGEGPQLLASVASKPLQPSLAQSHEVAMGSVSPNGRPPVSIANFVSKLPRALEARALILADISSQPLLQATTMVLGQVPPNQAAFVSPTHPEALDWIQMGKGAHLLALVASQPL